MNEARRRAYLEAMEIRLWVARDALPEEPQESVAVEVPVLSVETVPAVQAAPSPVPESKPESQPEPRFESDVAAVSSPPEVPKASKPAPTEPPQDASMPFFGDVPPPMEEPPQLEGISAWDDAPDVDESEAPAADNGVARMDWPELETCVADCKACALHQSRSHTVFGVGSREAELMIIGEAPGAEEDRQGEPFVGRAGKLLDAMLRAIGYERSQVYIANILKCRPPNNRNPHVEEVAACEGYLQRQIALIRPRLILSVGGVSAHNLLKTDEAVGRLRRDEHSYGPAGTPLLVTYHPAYLLRQPAEKAKAWADLQRAQRRLEVLRGGGAE